MKLKAKSILSVLLLTIITFTLAGCSDGIEPISTLTPTYTITWEVNGTIVETDFEVENGTMPNYDGATPLKNDAQYEYSFTGWTPELGVVIQNQKYTAVFAQGDIKEYTITWKDADNSILGTSTVPYGILPTYKLPEDTNQWDYIGWTPSVVNTNGNATYTAVRELPKHTITWKNDDGSIISTSEVELGSIPEFNEIELLESSANNENYKFYSWTPELEEVSHDMEYMAQYSHEVDLSSENYYQYFRFDIFQHSGGFRVSITPKSNRILEFKNLFMNLNISVYYEYFYRDNVYLNRSETITYTVTIHLNGENPEMNWEFSYPSLNNPPNTLIDFNSRSVFFGLNPIENSTGTIFVIALPITRYTINYNLNYGINNSNNPDTYLSVTPTILLEKPTKEGYTFLGWYDNAEYVGYPITKITTGTNGDITLYAKWSISNYTITFNSNGGSEVSNISQDYPNTVTEPAKPTKKGYTFGGWYMDELLTQAYTFNTIPAENINLYAKWTINQYTITFNSGGGSIVSSLTQDYATTINEPEKPVAEGYTFVAWFTDESLSNVYIFDKMPADNLTLYAGWTINQYTITFISNGGLEIDSITQDYASVITEQVTTKEGYTFDGWYTDEGLNERFILNSMPSENITLYAGWNVNTYNITLSETNTHTVSFDRNDGSGIYMSQSITEFNSITYPDIPSRSSYLFAGWYANKTCTGLPFDFSMPVESDMVLYAKWVYSSNTVIDYNGEFSFNTDGFEVSKYYDFFSLTTGQITIDVDYFTSPVFNAVLIVQLVGASSGYRIESSSDDITLNVVAGEKYTLLIYDSQWSQRGTTAHFKMFNNKPDDGGLAVNTTQTVEYISFFVLDIPEKEGFTFSGWYDGIDGTGTQYTDMYGVSTRPWDKLSDTILYPNWVEFNGLSEININDFDSYFGIAIYSSLPKIFSNNYNITFEHYDEYYIIYLEILDWSENDAYIYYHLLDTVFNYNESEAAWDNNNYYVYVYYDDTTYENIVYGIVFYHYN